MENKIEIPFGAKDTELKGWEYTIPENMEAEIKAGKIIVREKGCDDERIRKAILGLTYLDGIEPILTKYSITARDIRTYLEKQKEPKSQGVYVDCTEHPDWYGMSPKEQNPAWSEEDEKFINDLCNLLAAIAKNNYVGCYYAPDLINKIKSLRVRPITYALDAPLCYDNDMNPVYINHWKPSKEQMEALKIALQRGILHGTWEEDALKSLHNVLEKLI